MNNIPIQSKNDEAPMEKEFRIKGLMMDPASNSPIVLLQENEGTTIIPIWVGVFEANAIALQIERIDSPRPMTHDLMKYFLLHIGARIERVVVTKLEENTFYAIIEIENDGQSTTIDCRPSDALALAIRMDAPIFVTSQVIKNSQSLSLDRSELDPKDVREWLSKLNPDELGKYEM